jgi:hypothetical protein
MKKEFLITLSVLFIWTCGGGGGGSTPTEPIGPTEPSAPVVEDILLTTNEDVPSVINLEGTDPANLPLTFTIASQPTNGTFSLSGNAGTYTPNNNFNGSDTFTYFASNGSKSSNQGSVQITINPVNDDPESIDVSVSTNEDNSIDITLQANEYDGDTIVFQIDEQVSNGTLSLSGNIATYVPSSNWYGVDTFKFSVYDSSGRSIIKSGNGTIVVNALNDPPNVNDIYDIVVKSGEVQPIKLNAYDVDSYSVSYQIVDNPSNGHVTVSNDTAYFSPIRIGFDSFTFEAYDGTDYSSPGSVFLEIENSSDYEGIEVNLSYENDYYGNGYNAPATLLSNGNYLIAAALYKDPDRQPRFEGYRDENSDPPSYVPIHLLEVTEDGQVVDRVILDSFTNDFSDVIGIHQLSDNNIILVTVMNKFNSGQVFPGTSYNSEYFVNLLSEDYSVLIEDSTPLSGSESTFNTAPTTFFDTDFTELDNGNIIYNNKLFNSSLEIIATFDSYDKKAYYNNVLYEYCFDALTNSNSICSYDENGTQLGIINFDQNSNTSSGPLFKTSYGFLLSGSTLVRFDNDFNVLSYGTSGSMSYVRYQDSTGFISIIKSYDSRSSNFEMTKYDEYGNEYFNSSFNRSNISSILQNDRGNFILIFGPPIFLSTQYAGYNYLISNAVSNFEHFDIGYTGDYLERNYWWYYGYNNSFRSIFIQTRTNNGNLTY